MVYVMWRVLASIHSGEKARARGKRKRKLREKRTKKMVKRTCCSYYAQVVEGGRVGRESLNTRHTTGRKGCLLVPRMRMQLFF